MTLKMNGFDEMDAAVLDRRMDDEPARAAALFGGDGRSATTLLRDGAIERSSPDRAHAMARTTPTVQGSRVSKR